MATLLPTVTKPEKRFIPLLKVFSVFNLDQVDRLTDDPPTRYP